MGNFVSESDNALSQVYRTGNITARLDVLPGFPRPVRERVDQHEHAERVCGSIVRASVRGEDLWSVARILDEDAALS
jgi:hypothetical protein